MLQKVFLLITVILFTCQLYLQDLQAAPTLDEKIQRHLDAFSMQPITPPSPHLKNKKLFNLGKKLFFDQRLSGNNNISCSSCHHPQKGTGDGLPLSLGEGMLENALGMNKQHQGKIIQRNSPPLYNLSQFDLHRPMFWDGRVRYNEKTRMYETPLDQVAEVASSPYYHQLLQTVSSPLALQTLFPLINHDEMLGDPGENELVQEKNEIFIWQKLMKKILQDETYQKLFQQAFSQTPTELNIAYLGNALAHFITYQFAVTETPFDQYQRGDLHALSEQEKKGLWVFLGVAKCIQCHHGPQLAESSFLNIGIPHLERKNHPQKWNDLGRAQITKNYYRDQHKFKVPGLRNIALTAPYMHNGVFATLSEVINHYDDPLQSLLNADFIPQRNGPYQEEIEVNHQTDLITSLQAVDLRVSGRMDLTAEEKEDLEVFLKKSLTQVLP